MQINKQSESLYIILKKKRTDLVMRDLRVADCAPRPSVPLRL